MARGVLSEAVKKKSKEVLGYEITLKELRLMPYMDYTMKNNQYFDMRKIDDIEHAILHDWSDKGFITGTLTNPMISKKFYDAIQEILWVAYVNYKNEKQS